ncbi:MAG: hypothetical protein SPL25_10670 [Succinivibrionaceae bacterium]|nr:hypothetical protein [Succinivibrionaceae bacterium]
MTAEVKSGRTSGTTALPGDSLLKAPDITHSSDLILPLRVKPEDDCPALPAAKGWDGVIVALP